MVGKRLGNGERKMGAYNAGLQAAIYISNPAKHRVMSLAYEGTYGHYSRIVQHAL